MNKALYLFKFEPILKEKIWGGHRISELQNRKDDKKYGESWEISDLDEDISLLKNGELKGKTLNELVRLYKGELLGEGIYQKFGNKFPLLLKFIDAEADLSIQVHPNDALAKQRYNTTGKTEMWYIMEADEGAKLVCGWKEGMNKEKYEKALLDKTVESCLNYVYPKKGDCYFISAGTVHSIGKGLLIVEVQQSSDITYRIYDFDRIDKNGNRRDLHLEEAEAAMDFQSGKDCKIDYFEEKENSNLLVKNNFFTTNKLSLSKPKRLDYTFVDSFVSYICVKGAAKIFYNETEFIEIEKGETVLKPRVISEINIVPKQEGLELLESYI